MRTPFILLVSLLLAACGADTSDEAAASGAGGEADAPAPTETRPELADAEADRVWRGVLDSIAPDGGWERTRYLQFTWAVNRGSGEPLRRHHRWDRWENRYRVEAPVEDGRLVALFDPNAPTEGERVWLDGERVPEGERSDELVEQAHGMFVNDSYWLLFPFKWGDPGVEAAYLGEMEEWGETWEVVELTFADVGLTPQNRYRAFVDPESGMMELWQYYQNADDEEPGFTLRWTDWQRYGPILLSSRRETPEGDSRIFFEDLEASTDVPSGAFDPPGTG